MAINKDENLGSKGIHGRNILDWGDKGKLFYYARDFTKFITLLLKDMNTTKVVVEVDDENMPLSILEELVKTILPDLQKFFLWRIKKSQSHDQAVSVSG